MIDMFDNPIPIFEIGKDSYILKHKIDYNTSCTEGDLSGTTNKMLFTDYDLARKSQTSNSEDYDPIVITEDLTNINFISFKHYDQEYNIGLYGRLLYTDIVSGTTFINNAHYQQYYIEPFLTSLIDIGDYFNVYFQDIEQTSGTTIWIHTGPSGDTWVKTGTTENNIDWQVTGTTTENGISTGEAIWEVVDYDPILKYQARVIEIGADYIRLEKKIEDYLYNDISNDYDNAYYELESIDFTTKSYHSIKYIFEESIWGDYFEFDSTDTSLTITPTQNINDIYFDYDNVQMSLSTTGGTIDYKFETDCLYTKYKLDRFFEQFGFGTGQTINHNYLSDATSLAYDGEVEFDIEMTNSGDTLYFMPYTYVRTQVNSLSGNTYISLIKEISGTTITLITSRDFVIGDEVISINNLYTIGDISDMLYECYINIEGDEDNIPGYFYTGNYFDPNIFGINVIDPNIIGSWEFDPNL